MAADGELGRTIGFGGAGRAMRENGLSSSYDLKSFDGRLGLDKSAAVRDVVGNSYGGDTHAFAQMGIANDRALANVFGNGDNYAGFLTANMDKSVGQLQGEMGAYAGARSLGFSGSWREFNSLRSEISALGDYANADAVRTIADSYGISSAHLMQMNSLFNQGKQASEVSGLSNQLGGPVAAGTEAGRVVATETGGKIQGIYAGGGYGNYQQLTSNDVSGRIARNQLVHAASDQMVGRIAPQLKNDPEMYKDGHLTERALPRCRRRWRGRTSTSRQLTAKVRSMSVWMAGSSIRQIPVPLPRVTRGRHSNFRSSSALLDSRVLPPMSPNCPARLSTTKLITTATAISPHSTSIRAGGCRSSISVRARPELILNVWTGTCRQLTRGCVRLLGISSKPATRTSH